MESKLLHNFILTLKSRSPNTQYFAGQATYFSPSPRKCWPINRIMSLSEFDIVFLGDVLSSISPFKDPEQVPFWYEVDAISVLSPLCTAQPLVCILAQIFCFLRGGWGIPPSSESEDDASMLLAHLYGRYLSGYTNHR